jgi:hypothetical protein
VPQHVFRHTNQLCGWPLHYLNNNHEWDLTQTEDVIFTYQPGFVSGAFSKLISAVEECSKYESAYCDIEGTQNLLVQRESELKSAKEELQKEKNNHTHLITRQAEELKSRDTEKQILETANGKLKETLENERKRMDGTLKEERKKTGDSQGK